MIRSAVFLGLAVSAATLIACGSSGSPSAVSTVSSTSTPCKAGVLTTPANTPPATPTNGPPSAITAQATTTADGLQTIDLHEGSGATARGTSCVVVKYIGWLADGTIFDSSAIHRGALQISLRQVILGWAEGVPGMKAGGKRRLIVPPDLGYGRAGQPPLIPPNATLTFDIELISIQ